MEKTLYAQVKDWLMGKINDKTYKPGDLVPSQSELVSLFGVSKATVNKAISELVYEGYLTRIQGKGTFVQSSPRVARTKSGSIGFKEEMLKSGREVVTDPIATKIIQDSDLASLFNLTESAQFVFYQRRRLIDGTVVAIQSSYVPNKYLLYEDNIVQKSGKELYSLLRQRGYTVKKAHEVYTIERVQDEEILRLMNIKPLDPVFKVKRLSELEDGTLLEYVESYLKWDYYQIEVDLDDQK